MSETKDIIPSNEEDEEITDPIGVINSTKKLTKFFQQNNHSINLIHLSEIPQICKNEPCQLGIDEAGRGPVLGPMVYGILYVPISQAQLLKDLGCADSKKLTESQRNDIFQAICDRSDSLGWAVEAISPVTIANSMYRRSKVSLNEVSMNSAIGLVNKAIEAGVNVTEVYVDTVGPSEKYQAKLEKLFPGIKIVVEKKADSLYPVVSAASICAKVSRDHALRAWRFRENSVKYNEYGSGYPNDPVTKKWLSSNLDPVFGFPQIVRFSWSTSESILDSRAVKVEWEKVDDNNEPSDRKISHFFSVTPKAIANHHEKKHPFFLDRCLSNISDL